MPASADVVFVAHLDPAASQKMNLFRMAEKFPALGSEEELRQKLNDALDSVLADTGMTHEDLAWVGGEAGGYVDVGAGTPSFAIMVATDDEAAASAAMQRMRDASHADVHDHDDRRDRGGGAGVVRPAGHGDRRRGRRDRQR